MAQIVDRREQRTGAWIFVAAPHERAVYLDEVDRQGLQIAEGRETGAEVIQGEAAAERGHASEKASHRGQVAYQRGLGDLEAQLCGTRRIRADLLLEPVAGRRLAQRLTPQIDGDVAEALHHPGIGGEPPECRTQREAVDGRGERIAL